MSFLTQSGETIENKGFVFFVGAKKSKGVWKQQEVQEIGRKHVGRFEGWNVEKKEVKRPDRVGIFDSECRAARDLRWQGLLFRWWSREFTTHGIIYYLLCQFHKEY